MPWQAGSTKRKPKDTITWSKVLTPQEQHQLMSYLKSKTGTIAGERLFLICDLMLNTGLRITELAALRIQDTPAVLGKNFIEVIGKGKKRRSIQIAPELAEKLERYIKTIRPKTLPRHVRRKDVTKPIFYSRHRRPYLRKVKTDTGTKITATRGLYGAIHKAGIRADLRKNLHPHMLRHSFATDALSKGIRPEILQNKLGHSSLITTMKYLHFADDQDEALGQQLYKPF